MRKLLLPIVSIALLLLGNSVFAGRTEEGLSKKGIHVADLSEEDKIDLNVNRLEQAIRFQWTQQIFDMLSASYSERDCLISFNTVKDGLEGIFSDISRFRQFSPQFNHETGWSVTACHDFYIRILDTNIQGDHASVVCELGFLFASKNLNQSTDTLSFVPGKGGWALNSSVSLFSFLKKASQDSTEQMGIVDVPTEVLFQTKDDFTSASLLVPVTFYNYGKTPIPRFNKTESLNWFGLNCMSHPGGIITDIEIVEGGPDFNHEFLFISDITSHKILGCDHDDWVGEFGSKGSGYGQFWCPHGLCTLDGCIYLAADLFNDRVIAYRFDEQMEEPEFYGRLDLYCSFNHPKDVEAKERRTGDLQDVSYVAVADENNHRIALFLWEPCFMFDRVYGEWGSGQGQFMWPSSVCFGREPDSAWQTNDLFVTDYGNRRLVRLYVETNNVNWKASYNFPSGIELSSVEVDNKGLVYTLDNRNARVYKFAPYENSFKLLGIWGETGTQDGQLYHPNSIQVAHGRYVPYPDPEVPMGGLGDVFITEAWGYQTGVRRFVIAADVLNLTPEWVPYNEDTGQGNFIWWNYHLTDFATVTEQVLLGAEVCTTYTRGTLNWGSQGGSWPVDGHTHGAYYTVKVAATSIYDPTMVVEKTVDVYVDTLSTHNPVITQGIRCHVLNDPFASCDGCWQCIKENDGYVIDVEAYHPDGHPLSYEWHCGRGYFVGSDMSICNPCFEDTNEICYIAPDAPSDKGDQPYEFIRVDVYDPYGGESWDIQHPIIFESDYSCLCGDAQVNGTVNVNDALYIQGYLFQGGPPPPDPIERADANNDCTIDMEDVIYILNYLFRGGPAPECCWLHD